MKISKIFNNNCVATLTDDVEYIITGKGIGFQKKIGDIIDENNIEKKFSIIDDNLSDFESLLSKVSVDYFESTRAIVEYAFHKFDMKLNDAINITLTDHISYAIQRAKEGIEMPGIFNDDLAMFYPTEYSVAQWSLAFLNSKYDVDLPNDEIGYIAIHVVNSREGNQSHMAQNMIYFLKEVINIISKDLEVEIDQSSMEYKRLTTHLKYLAHRVFGGVSDLDNASDGEMNQILSAKLSKYTDTVVKIASFIDQRFDYAISLDERMYLSIHIYQIMQSINRNK